jgi:hypothetical protein
MTPMRRKQRGITAVLVAVGLLGLLAMAALALDTGHLVLNKSRLQNTVDAAALAAAKVLDQTGSESQATAAARSVFDLNAAGQPELKKVLSGADITVQYSHTLSPFAPGTLPANYVRARADSFTMWSSFARLVGIDELSTAATAVAGPSAPIAEACDLAPITVCGDPGDPPGGNPASDWGFEKQDVTVLKLAAQTAGATISPGNFQLIRLGGTGANVVRQNLAGGYQGCVADTVVTQPGDEAGPVRQGLNTRFNQYQGGGINKTSYPPDLYIDGQSPALTVAADDITVMMKGSGGKPDVPFTNISQLSYPYSRYQSDYLSKRSGIAGGVPARRELAVPIVDCTGATPGVTELRRLGFGCFFLLQPVALIAGGKDGYVFAEYIGQCASGGVAGPEPGPEGGPGIYKIVLHNDPASPDS